MTERPPFTTRAWSLLAIASALLMIGGAGAVLSPEGNDTLGLMALAVGLVILGAWLAVELRAIAERDRDDD